MSEFSAQMAGAAEIGAAWVGTRRDDESQWQQQAFSIALFTTAKPQSAALGVQKQMTWPELIYLCHERRQGHKDGHGFCAAEFISDSPGQVRRLGKNLKARTLVVLDIESSKETGEIPPPISTVRGRLETLGLAALLYTSHSHQPNEPRFRIILPLNKALNHTLPAVEVVADLLQLSGVFDRTKLAASSFFYLPSCEHGKGADHDTLSVDGQPLDAERLGKAARDLQAQRETQRQRQRGDAMEAAARRSEQRKIYGYDDDSNLIEAIRSHLDLHGELVVHGYEPTGDGRYLFSGSQSGIAGVCVMTGRDGVDRVYSHHAGDPLAATRASSHPVESAGIPKSTVI